MSILDLCEINTQKSSSKSSKNSMNFIDKSLFVFL